MKFSLDSSRGATMRLPTSVKTVGSDLANALEAKLAQRLRELGGWQPSNGWLTERTRPASGLRHAWRG